MHQKQTNKPNKTHSLYLMNPATRASCKHDCKNMGMGVTTGFTIPSISANQSKSDWLPMVYTREVKPLAGRLKRPTHTCTAKTVGGLSASVRKSTTVNDCDRTWAPDAVTAANSAKIKKQVKKPTGLLGCIISARRSVRSTTRFAI